jgi:hypothetical protein
MELWFPSLPARGLVAAYRLSYRAGWGNGNVIYLYMGGARFEAWPGHRLFWLRVFVAFLSPSKQIPGSFLFKSFPIYFSPIILSFDAIRCEMQRRKINRKPQPTEVFRLYEYVRVIEIKKVKWKKPVGNISPPFQVCWRMGLEEHVFLADMSTVNTFTFTFVRKQGYKFDCETFNCTISFTGRRSQLSGNATSTSTCVTCVACW